MELRKLQASDLFSMVRILNLIGFKNLREAIDFNKITEARKNISNENSDEVFSNLGSELIFPLIGVIVENLPKIENELYKFLGSLANMKDKEVAKMGANEFMDLLVSVFKKEEFADFFKQASKLIK